MTGTGAHGVGLSLFAPLGAIGLPVAFLHAAPPEHRSSFVPDGQGLGWSRGETGAVAAPAGLGHVGAAGRAGGQGPVVRLGIEAAPVAGGASRRVTPHGVVVGLPCGAPPGGGGERGLETACARRVQGLSAR